MNQRVERMERTFATDLDRAIFEFPLCDTHEHLHYEKVWNTDESDVLRDLLNNYVPADLKTAGADQKAIDRALDAKDPDLEGRLAGILPALERSRYTGYGEAVYLNAKAVYGMDRITVDGLVAAQPILDSLKKPGERLRLLREVAGLEHTQTDDFVWACLPDSSGPDFFFYDLSWRNFCNAEIPLDKIKEETGVEVRDLTSLEEGMTGIFDKYAPCAIAVKTQHAYNRTIQWKERARADAEIALNKLLSHPQTDPSEEDKLCLGDWCWAKGVELSIKYELPFKIHTGYYAGNNHMRMERIKSANLCDMLIKYRDARFVLMHISYPYNDEIVALAKHFPNTVVDLCWAWSIDPYSSKDFMRRLLHSVPVNKVMGFGGDTRHPTCSYAYALQARKWISRMLSEEVREGYLTEKEAIEIARRWMNSNQKEYFRLDNKRTTIREWTGERLG